MKNGTQYLRESAMLEVIYDALENDPKIQMKSNVHHPRGGSLYGAHNHCMTTHWQ